MEARNYIKSNPKEDCGSVTFDSFPDSWGIEWKQILHKDGIASYLNEDGDVVMAIPETEEGIKTLTELK